MKHTIEYNGIRRTIDAKRTATICEVAELAFGPLAASEYPKVICHGSGKYADKVADQYRASLTDPRRS